MIIAGVAIVALVLVGGFLFMNMLNSSSKNTQATKMTTTTTPVTESETMNDKNIVVVAKEAGTFTTLLAAAEAAGLVETLSGPGPLTVLAPTDEAFAKLPAGTVESLLKDKEQLAKILTYHVIAGKVMSNDIVGMDSATTVQGGKVTIKTENGKVMINNATVTNPDIEASNGVIHVIDTVLIPE
jgi:uncharacterized surface protein with fasciclin (FAS1) repeats